MISRDELLKIMPYAKSRVDAFLDPLNACMVEFEIDNPKREAAFLAQIAHESSELRYVREIASGAEYDTGRIAAKLGNTPDGDGDGEKYKGRGLIQITGHNNYQECGEALDLPLVDSPSLLEEPVNACRSAAWYWRSHGCNELADSDQFKTITRRINGGLNGYPSRAAYWERAKAVLMA